MFGKKCTVEHRDFFSEHEENKTMDRNRAFVPFNHLLVHHREAQNIFEVQKVLKLKKRLCPVLMETAGANILHLRNRIADGLFLKQHQLWP